MSIRRALKFWRGDWEEDVLEALNDLNEALDHTNYYLALIAPRVRIAASLQLTFVSTNPVHFYKPGEPVTMTDTQQVIATLLPLDGNGNPTALDPGLIPLWGVKDNLLSVVPTPDGLSAVVSALGPVGDSSVTVRVIGLPTVQNIVHVTVSRGTKLGIKFGKPTTTKH